MDLITAAIPFFFLLMGVELVVGRLTGRKVFRGPDVMNNLALGVLQVLFGVVAASLLAAIYLWGYQHRVITLPNEWWVWVLAFVGVDFCYYWFHRASHRMMIVWASHAPHHSSEDYNLAVALRQGPVQPLLSRAFYLPMAFLGVSFEMFALLVTVITLYQFWIHTELIGRLGPLEWILNTPSHHRVHHGCNGAYIDKNHGGTFIIWDKMFGTFEQEGDTPIYGTVKASATWNPLIASWQPFGDIGKKLSHSRSIPDVVRAVFGPPEWLPATMRASPAVTGPRAKYDERPATSALAVAVVLFIVTLALSVVYLVLAAQLSVWQMWLGAGVLTASYGVMGLLLDSHSHRNNTGSA